MNSERKIMNKIISLKELTGKTGNTCILCLGIVLFVLVLLFFAYSPLIIKLHNAGNKLQELETRLIHQRNAVAVLNISDLKVQPMQQEEVPFLIYELTEKGRNLGLNFNSILPGRSQDTEQAGIQKLPVHLTIESEYENAGRFLTDIEELSHGIAEVESLSIRPGKKIPSGLNVNLLLNLYVETENETQ